MDDIALLQQHMRNAQLPNQLLHSSNTLLQNSGNFYPLAAMTIPGLMNFVPNLNVAMARKRDHDDDLKTELYAKVQRG